MNQLSANNVFFINFGVGIVTFLLLGLLVRWLWNSTLPELFNVKKITFYQALKILALSLILTGGLSVLGISGAAETATIKLDFPR